MTSPRSDTARNRAKRWNLGVKHALYRMTGDWYHQLKHFPGALLDSDGYVMFETEDAYRNCPQLRIRKDVNVPGGIKGIPGYTRVGALPPKTPISYEMALHREGALTDVVQTKKERDPAARKACIEAHGPICAVCGVDFEGRYGSIGRGFIHVHHLLPLADGERLVDPIKDLIPLCPNCHAMAHKKNPPIPIEELRKLLRR